MSVKARKEHEQYEKKFALYQELQKVTGKEYSIEQGAALLSCSIPDIKRLLKRIKIAKEQQHV